MHKLPIGSGFIGLVFAVGSALIFLLGLPALWYFVAFSAALGVGIALVFRLVNARRSDRAKSLSIVSAMEKAPRREASDDCRRDRMQSMPMLDPA